MADLFSEIKWRGLAQSNTCSGDLFHLLNGKSTTFYVGTDPTGKSLHVGHLLAFIVARILQSHGHRPIVLVGGATALLGDPSFKAEERKLISVEEMESNAANIKKQLSHLIDFNSSAPNAAIMVNNYDWMKDYSFLDFSREVGKLITINYMIAKESVQKRLSREGNGLSFTEFTYQLLQGNDFKVLNERYGCKLQIGGSDQFGNAMTGIEVMRKSGINIDECAVMTWPLVTRADGTKFGKSEGGKNIWLDPTMTSPYEFYQFWLNQSDEDAKKYIKMFTLLSKEEIETLIAEHEGMPHLHLLQKRLAFEVTTMVHGLEEANKAIDASKALFDKNSTIETFKGFDEKTLCSIFNGVPHFNVSKEILESNPSFIDLAVDMGYAASKGEIRKLIQGGGISVNLSKIDVSRKVNLSDMLHGKYMILRKGSKTYSFVTVN